ncbi:MAG: hypothetical protein AAFR93_01880 [Pseudomonadota bacterium]
MQIDPSARIPLGVSQVIQMSFQRFFARIGVYLMLAVGPAFLAALLGAALAPSAEDLSVNAFAFLSASTIVVFLMQTVLGAIGTGLVIYAAADTERQAPARIAGYFGATLANLVPLVVLSLVVSVIGVLAMFALIVPGLWVFAVFSVMTPALLLEATGWGSMQRSQEMTQGYRWPIVGSFFQMGLIFLVITVLIGLVVGLSTGSGFGAPPSVNLGSILTETLTTTLFSGLSAVFVLTLYLRLKEIREGSGISSVSDVFR